MTQIDLTHAREALRARTPRRPGAAPSPARRRILQRSTEGVVSGYLRELAASAAPGPSERGATPAPRTGESPSAARVGGSPAVRRGPRLSLAQGPQLCPAEPAG